MRGTSETILRQGGEQFFTLITFWLLFPIHMFDSYQNAWCLESPIQFSPYSAQRLPWKDALIQHAYAENGVEVCLGKRNGFAVVSLKVEVCAGVVLRS
jgi:hypothetical protein